jgi:cytochrome P450
VIAAVRHDDSEHDRPPSAPGPAPTPLVGSLPQLLRFGRDPIGTVGGLFAKYGPLVSLVRAPARIMSPGGRWVVAVNGPALNREVLTEHDRYRMYALPGVYFPDEHAMERARRQNGSRGRPTVERLQPVQRTLTGLFHVNGDEHRRHRRLLQPAFGKTRIDAYRDDMVSLTRRMLDEWREGEERDVLEDITELTLAIATKTLFGEDARDRGVALARMMRILPPVPLHPRIVAEDTELGGHFLPARTELFLSIFHMHHDPALFPDPKRFDPKRWSTIKPSAYEYNPFSAGPRMCIGAAFAMMEIKIALAMLLQRFRVERARAGRIDRRVAITMAPRNGLRMIIRKADGAWKSARRALPDVRGDIREIVELP